MKFISSVLACGVTVFADKEVFSDGGVEVKFLGKSGGIKLTTPGGEIKVHQAKVEEVTSTGESCDGCKKLNMAGQGGDSNGFDEWSPVQTTLISGNGEKLYETTFTKEFDSTTFALSAHLSTATTTTTDVIPCPVPVTTAPTTAAAPAPTAAAAAVTAEPTAAAAAVTAEPTAAVTAEPTAAVTAEPTAAVTAEPTAAAGRRLLALTPEPTVEVCTQTVSITANELKFSLMLSGFTFQDSSNKLVYGGY